MVGQSRAGQDVFRCTKADKGYVERSSLLSYSADWHRYGHNPMARAAQRRRARVTPGGGGKRASAQEPYLCPELRNAALGKILPRAESRLRTLTVQGGCYAVVR